MAADQRLVLRDLMAFLFGKDNGQGENHLARFFIEVVPAAVNAPQPPGLAHVESF